MPTPLIDYLNHVFSPDDAARTLFALRQDPLVWIALESDETRFQVSQVIGTDPCNWTPAGIGAVLLGDFDLVGILSAEPMQVLDPGIRQQAIKTFEENRKKGTGPDNLREACLLALALRERRRLTGTWNGLVSELLTSPSGLQTIPIESWNTVMACLGGFIPHPEELMQSLLSAGVEKAGIAWVTHMLVVQPLAETVMIHQIVEITRGIPVVVQIKILKNLRQVGCEAVAAKVASNLLNGHPAFASFKNKLDLDVISTDGIAARALALQQIGTFHHLADSPAQAEACLRSAKDALDYWKTGLELQIASIASPDDRPFYLTDLPGQVFSRELPSKKLIEELGKVLVDQTIQNEVLDRVDETSVDPFFLLERAFCKVNAQESSVGKELGIQAANNFIEEIDRRGNILQGEYVYRWNFENFINRLVDLGLSQQALSCLDAILSLRPGDAFLLALSAKILFSLGNCEKAAEQSELSVALKPERVDHRRQLSEIYEKQGNWDFAYEQRKICVNSESEKVYDDSIAFANTALHCGRAEETEIICERILKHNLDHGEAHGYLGLAYATTGKISESILHLNRATLLVPEDSKWWLALATQYKRMSDEKTAIDTLRASIMATPDSGDLHYALGETLLDNGFSTEALPHLKRAALLLPDNEQISFRLCKALHSLGYLSEAKRAVENLRHKWSTQPEIAYEFANIALELGDLDAAVPALDVAVRSEKARPEWYLVYARLLLENVSELESVIPVVNYQQAENLLRKAVEINPNHFETRLMLAEALRKKGDFGEAYDIYSDLMNLSESVNPEQIAIIQHGMGMAALALNHVEPGLAMLREAAQRRPMDLELHHDLVHAFISAKLNNDAAQAAEVALGIAPDSLENLNWFADTMLNIGVSERAAESLRCGLELAPKRVDMQIRYAQLLVQSGNLIEARIVLGKLCNHENCSAEYYRQAAYLYLRMEEADAAKCCLEKAVNLTEKPSIDLFYDLAKVYERSGQSDDALELIQRAISGECADPKIYLLHANLLVKASRLQAAQVSLEKALKLAQVGSGGDDDLIAEIHEKWAHLLRQIGNVAEALQHAEKALEYAPDNGRLQLQTADLALSMLQSGRVQKLLQTQMVSIKPEDMDVNGLHLACMAAHVGLDEGKIGEAGNLLFDCKKINPEEIWVRTVEARLMAKQGDIARATRLVEQVLQDTAIEAIQPGDNSLWVAKAALETGFYDQSVDIIETFVRKYPAEPRGFTDLAHAYLRIAEIEHTCELLGCKAHAPGEKYLNEEAQKKFDTAIEMAGQLVKAADHSRLMARGKLVFAPSIQTVKSLAGIAESGPETAALIGGLRLVKNIQAAAQVAQKFSGDPDVQFQLALCYLDSEPEKGRDLVDTLLEWKLQPMYYALRSALARKMGESDIALDHIESALNFWPDEDRWHAQAAELAIQCGDIETGISHWKEAIKLCSTEPEYTLELGWAYIMAENYVQAGMILEKAVKMCPNNSSAWYNLAQARKAVGKFPEAMECSFRASELEVTGIQGFMLCSEIAQEMGELDLAKEYAGMALKRDAHNPKAVMTMSKVLDQQGRFEESLNVIEVALPDLPPSYEVEYEQAKLTYTLRGAVEAASFVQKLVQSYPEEAEVLALLAKIQADCGDIKAAERSAFKSLRINPHQPELAFTLGKMQRKAGQLDQAVHLLSQGISMDPHNMDGYLELGQTFTDRREHGQALQVYQNAIRFIPDDPRGYYQAALVLREGKDYMGAENMLERAAHLAPDDLQIRRQLVGVMALNLIHKSQEANTAV
jgi:tetratricopeptide (TPR) repeat protein